MSPNHFNLPFKARFKERVEGLILGLMSRKMWACSFWCWVATGLLMYKRIGEETWSLCVLSLMGIAFGIGAYEKTKGVAYGYRQQATTKIPEGGD